MQVAAEIDKRFANSSDETKTQTEKEFAQSFIKQQGDISFIVTSILGAVFFTLLFLTGNTMMQSVRERVPELAVLKTLGFTDVRGGCADTRRGAAAVPGGSVPRPCHRCGHFPGAEERHRGGAAAGECRHLRLRLSPCCSRS
jgi:hypothetical protein